MAFVLCHMGLGAFLGKDEPLRGSSPTGDRELEEGFPTCLTDLPVERVLVSLANTLWLVVPLRRPGSDESWLIPLI